LATHFHKLETIVQTLSHLEPLFLALY
jgi:hypothetical protein